jgi:hypothetical protein
MWCWRRMEKISWADHVRNEEVLLSVKELRNIVHEMCEQKAIWIGHILYRNCLLQQVIEGKIKGGLEVTGRRGRRHRKLLNGLKESRGYSTYRKPTNASNDHFTVMTSQMLLHVSAYQRHHQGAHMSL